MSYAKHLVSLTIALLLFSSTVEDVTAQTTATSSTQVGSSTVDEDFKHVITFDSSEKAASTFSFPAHENSEILGETPRATVGCHLHVDNPHKSMHNPGKINVVARLKCSDEVSQIHMTVALARDGEIISKSHYNKTGRDWMRESTPCMDGIYQGGAMATVIFKPGFNPPVYIMKANSNQIPIKCSL